MLKRILSAFCALLLLSGLAAGPSQAFSGKQAFHKVSAVSAKFTGKAVDIVLAPVHTLANVADDVVMEVCADLHSAKRKFDDFRHK